MKKTLAKTIYLTLQKIHGEPTAEILADLKKSQYWPIDKLAKQQELYLQNLLNWSAETVPAYKKHKNKTLHEWPLLEKNSLKENKATHISVEFKGPFVEWTTSGSSGDPLVVKRTLESLAYHHASIYRAHGWFDIGIGEREARLWGVPHTTSGRIKEQIKDFAMNRIRAAAYQLNEEYLELFWKRILKWKPAYLFGYSSLMNQMAEYVLQANLNGRGLNLKAVICTSETLADYYRTNITKAFGCPVVAEYGCTETGIIAYECPSGGFHISSEAVFVELLPSDVEGLNKVVLTDLHNYAMPIIRYNIGDLAAWDETPCPCGRQLPKLKNITGRESSIVITPEGKRVHTIVFYYALCDLKGGGISKFQVARKDDYKYSLRLIPGIGFKKDNMDFIKNKVSEILGKNTVVDFEIVRDIPRTSAGKFRDFVDERTPK